MHDVKRDKIGEEMIQGVTTAVSIEIGLAVKCLKGLKAQARALGDDGDQHLPKGSTLCTL